MQKNIRAGSHAVKALGCKEIYLEKDAFRCGDTTYNLVKEEREEFGPGIPVTTKRLYKTKFGDKLITEQLENTACPQSIEVQTSDGYLRMEVDDNCKVWDSRTVDRNQILF
jgi:hypothetical protein